MHNPWNHQRFSLNLLSADKVSLHTADSVTQINDLENNVSYTWIF